MAPHRTSVCVVGAGPAGLLLALLLAKRGVHVTVLEGHEDFEREFRGEVLQPSTVHLLDELGLLEYTLAEPPSILTRGIVRIAGATALLFNRVRACDMIRCCGQFGTRLTEIALLA
jgi:2-polyprenyl-6-methoxyphenol hydroxylase-like FAD-dependent oxidoreductase